MNGNEKEKDINKIVEFLEETTAEKVKEILIFVKTYLKR